MSQQPLEIHIKKGVDTAEATKTPTGGEVVPTKKGETSNATRATQAHLIKVVKDTLNLAVNKTGDLSGNYTFANKVSNAVAVGGVITTLVVAGPIIGGIMVGGQALISGATAGIDNYVEIRNLKFNNERLGRISRAGSG